MDFAATNWIAVLVAAVSAFGLGALWYGPPLFGKRWQALVGMSDEEIASGNMVAIYGTTFILQLIAVIVLSFLIPEAAGVGTGALTGLGVGAAWVATAMGVTYLFEQKPFGLYLINAGYHVAYYTLAGAILGLF